MNRSQKTKFLSLCLAGVLILPAGTAFADDAADAAAYYQQASEAYQAEDYTRADELLARAYAKDPDLIYQYNRVLANQAKGDFKAALAILDTFQAQMLADPDARFTDIPEIRVNLEQAEAKAVARREAAERAQQVPSTVPAPPVVEPTLDEGVSSSQILGWSLVGVGAVSLGASALFGSKVLISDIDDRFECERSNRTGCYSEFGDTSAQDKQFQDDVDTWDTHNTLTWVTLGVGAAALIGGGVVLYLDAQEHEDSTVSAAASGAKLEWTPYVSADGAGGTFNFSF